MHGVKAAVPAFILAPPAPGGCVNGMQQREAQLAPLIGRPETELVQRLGVPTRTCETQGNKFIACNETRLDHDPGLAGTCRYGGGFGAFGGFPPQVYVRSCEPTCQITGGAVSWFALHGNSCDYGAL